MESLERNLEVYEREARNHERQGRSFRDLAKKTRIQIEARDKAKAEVLTTVASNGSKEQDKKIEAVAEGTKGSPELTPDP